MTTFYIKGALLNWEKVRRCRTDIPHALSTHAKWANGPSTRPVNPPPQSLQPGSNVIATGSVLSYASPPNALSSPLPKSPSKVQGAIPRERKIVARSGLEHPIRLRKSFQMSYRHKDLTVVFIPKPRHQCERRLSPPPIQNDFSANEVSCEDARFWYPPAPVTVLLLRFFQGNAGALGAPNPFPII